MKIVKDYRIFLSEYCERQNYLVGNFKKENSNNNETIEVIAEFIEDIIDDSAGIVIELDKILDNTI